MHKPKVNIQLLFINRKCKLTFIDALLWLFDPFFRREEKWQISDTECQNMCKCDVTR